jgi:hypothetical protein
MKRSADTFTRSDLELLHRALAYRRKRVHEPGAVVRMQGLLDRVEELLLEPAGASRLRLSPPEQALLHREVPLYCEELTRRGAAEAGAQEARRLRELLHLLAAGAGPRTIRPAWLRRLFGR